MTKTSKATKDSGLEPLVFFGTGPVAAEALRKLIKNFAIEAVLTKPKPPHHRGNFPVLEVAEQLGLKILTATDKKSLSELFKAKPVKSRIGLVIDFGIIIGQDVIDYFPLGIVNSHFSLLPRWRGADPISYAILNGDDKTGVSLMLIDAGMDTGELITYKTLKIEANDTSTTLTDKLIDLSDELLRSYLPKYIMGDIKPKKQPHPDRATYSSKLNKEDGQINWSKSADRIEREIRAYLDWPKSRTNLADIEVIITQAHVDETAIPQEDCKPGKAWVENKQILVQTCDLPLVIDKLKPAGKPEMTAQAFLAGYRLS
jgi:methionyl-tRNA formyltransferase